MTNPGGAIARRSIPVPRRLPASSHPLGFGDMCHPVDEVSFARAAPESGKAYKFLDDIVLA